MAKKYFWLKLKTDFFSQKEIKKLRKIAGGDTYTIIYLKMQLLSIKNEGKLFFEGVEESFAEEIALELDEDVENVRVTLLFLEKHNLIELVNTDEYVLPATVEAIGSESASATRVRRHRESKEKQKALQCNTIVTKCNTEIEQQQELDKEKELEIQQREVGETDVNEKSVVVVGNDCQETSKKEKKEVDEENLGAVAEELGADFQMLLVLAKKHGFGKIIEKCEMAKNAKIDKNINGWLKKAVEENWVGKNKKKPGQKWTEAGKFEDLYFN